VPDRGALLQEVGRLAVALKQRCDVEAGRVIESVATDIGVSI
jgi:hypothetical protein